MRDDAVERLFSLFVPSDRAIALAGDLAEERQRRGWTWYWLHVARVTLVLWRNAATEAPLQLLGLMLLGSGLLIAPAFAGVAAVFLVSPVGPMSWIAASLFWWGGAFWTGAAVRALSPRRGMATCATLAVVGAALAIGLGATIQPHELSTASMEQMFSTIALGATVALLAGGGLARAPRVAVTVPLALAVGLVATVLFMMAAVSAPSAHQLEWRDPSPHAVKSVTVEADVQLEVLDWGGSGPALVLLSGLGGTAHQYDDLAQALTPRYRVIGVTRRGHRGSSPAVSGYGFARLAEDVMRVIDASGITNPVVIGHSFAGEEMHVLGARHSANIRGLVYVDAAFDRGDNADGQAYAAVAKTLPAGPSPESTDLTSFSALRAFLEKNYGTAGPEGYLRTRYRTNADGTVGGFWSPDAPVRQAMAKEIQAGYKPYDPERIRVPALAIYAVPKSPEDLMRRGSSDRLRFPESFMLSAAADPDVRGRIEKLFLLTRERVDRHEKWFAAFAERGRVAEVSGAHDLIVSNADEVLEHIEAFISSLEKAP
jgi:pimeloyl-ACP methyl ester carboxylesterase